MLKLGLGTVQFGLDYGIANPGGTVPEDEVGEILELASAAGVQVLDTAPAYGHAQAVLGRWLRPEDGFRIISKTVAVSSPVIGEQEVATVQAAFDASLAALNVERIAGVLVHQADDLLKPGGERLYACLEEWRVQGRVAKVGVSVYERRQIEAILERYPMDLVQLPLNVFDQRLVRDGTLRALADRGIEIHARSVFLQGLLLMHEEALPAFSTPWRQVIHAFHADVRRAGTTPLAAALAFVNQRPEIDVVLVGVASLEQWRQCLSALEHPPTLAWDRYAVDDPRLVDPRLWPAKD